MPVHTTDDGCRLDYVVSGPDDAPPLVLLNSLGSDRGMWDAQAGALARRHRLLRYDTRGHGASDAPAGDYTLERLGRDLLTVMHHAGVARAHVAGVSLGGLTALWLGVHAPDRVDRLVLANTAARIGSVPMWAERKRVVEAGGLAAIADATMERWFTASFRAARPETVARRRATLEAVPVAGYLGCCAALSDADLRGDAARVRARTLVITGTHDPATPPADGAALAAAIPGAALLEFDAAHLTNVECGPVFTEALMKFLST
jgi:3-oxoadipate enol-lactonase